MLALAAAYLLGRFSPELGHWAFLAALLDGTAGWTAALDATDHS